MDVGLFNQSLGGSLMNKEKSNKGKKKLTDSEIKTVAGGSRRYSQRYGTYARSLTKKTSTASGE